MTDKERNDDNSTRRRSRPFTAGTKTNTPNTRRRGNGNVAQQPVQQNKPAGGHPQHGHGGNGGKKHPKKRSSSFTIGNRTKRPTSPPKKSVLQTTRPVTNDNPVPALPDGDIRIIPLGGVEQIGKNMTAIEYKDTIVVIDAGVQFREETTPGIDFIIPNTKYLETSKKKVVALIITHGHLDHIGGIPYVMEKLGNPPIYSRKLTTLMIQKRQEEFPHLEALNIKMVEKNSTITAGELKLKFFGVTHTIPDSMGVMVQTPYGNIVHTGDLKLDHTDGIPSDTEQTEFGKVTKETNLLLMADSTNVERPGFSIPERIVQDNIDEIIRGIKGRLIVGTFASLLERLMNIVKTAESLNKKVVIDGRSMKNNMEIARQAGLFTPKKGTVITIDEMADYPPDRIIILATGAQGDEFASLMRAANKKHKYIKIGTNDTILLSSSVVPGNERGVQRLKDNISRQGARIVHYRVSDVHSSGHANMEETKWIHKMVHAKFFIPVHGYHYMLRVHSEIAQSIGTPKENIVIPDNGMVIDITEKGTKLKVQKISAPSNPVMVDGFSISDMQEVVLRDRKMLAEDGIFVIVASIDLRTGKVRKSPDIISRGFVYLRESQDLLRQARYIAKKTIEESASGGKKINFDTIKDEVASNVGKFLLQQTAKRPMVIPVVLGS